MGFGKTTPAMLQEFERVVPKGRILDVACGDGKISNELARRGYTVHGIDPEAPKKSSSENVTFQRIRLGDEELNPAEYVAVFCSWPLNNHGNTYEDLFSRRLINIATKVGILAMLTKNTDGYTCGGLLLWQVVSRVAVLTSVPDPANVFTVYNMRAQRDKPAALPEEYAALTVCDASPVAGPVWYKDAYEKA